MRTITNVSIEQLKRAVQIKEQIAGLESELSSIFNSNASAQTASVSKPASGGMSAASRARLSAMAKARWAKIKAGNKPAVVKTANAAKSATPATKSGAKKTMSPEVRAKISAASKARWAKINAAKGK